jgi:transcriptional regulator with XRE-family HTH domain
MIAFLYLEKLGTLLQFRQYTTSVMACNTIVRFEFTFFLTKIEGEMPQPKKKIRHDEIVARFGQKLRELRLSRGMSQNELAFQAEVTTNYISRLEGGGAAPGIDLVARLAGSLGVSMADMLPMMPHLDDMAVTRKQAKKLFDDLMQSDDRAVLLVLTQVLARLVEANSG